MAVEKYIGDDGKSLTTMVKADDVEYVNPVTKFMYDAINGIFQMSYSGEEFARMHHKPSLFDSMTHEMVVAKLLKDAEESWKYHYGKIMMAELPKGIMTILEYNDKKSQCQILDKSTLSTNSLSRFIIEAYEKFGFTYSVYEFEHNHKGFDISKMPPFVHKKDDGSIEIIGTTELKDGQLKNAIDHRKVTLAKFLDKGELWHCFFYNYKSIGGNEAGAMPGIPHIHYISNAWTISRQEVLKRFREGNHPSSSTPHIYYKRRG